MDQQHESKRPRLSTPPSWSAGSSLHGLSLPQPGPPLTTPHLPAPSGPYQPSPHPFSRGPELPLPPAAHPPPHHLSHNPPPPPPPHSQHFDRRQHEPEQPYPPMQEHRQPPPSPAHPSYPPYPPPRDPVVKRDPAEDGLPQLRRPNSTGNGSEPLAPGTPHGSHIPPPPGHMDDRRHMSYDNGPSHMYRQPSYPPPPQTPLPPPTPYDQQPMYGPPPDALYPIAYASSTGKRKAQRASQACDMCRQLKAKCDELKPCKSCKEKNVECKYRDPVPKQQDKATADIMEGLQSLRDYMRDYMQEKFTGIDDRISRIEDRLDNKVPLANIPHRDDTMDFERPISPAAAAPEETTTSSPGEATMTEAPIEPEEARKTLQLMTEEEEFEVPPGVPVPPGKPKMPLDHTTPAGHLLTWPSIRDMVQPFLDKEKIKYIQDYPRRLEIRRGQLSLFGRGEGHDTRIVDRDGTADQGDIPDDVSVSSHPSSPGQSSDWGLIGGMTPPSSFDIKGTSVLRSDGSLDFDHSRVWALVKSYEQHIQNMHPLIIPKELHAMVRIFLDSFPPKHSSRPGPIAKFAPSETSPQTLGEHPGLKRKRSSPGPDLGEPSSGPKRGRPQRSIQTALVLLVLALGKISMVRDRRIPDIPEGESPAQDSRVVRNGQPISPNQSSPPAASIAQTAGLPSPKDQERLMPSRRSSFQAPGAAAVGPVAHLRKNYEVIPGLEYFAFATDILGNHLGGTQMIHVHAHLLAGLYYGQLGRVVPNFAHVRHAGITLMDNISSVLDRLAQESTKDKKQFATGKRDNQIATAFWSCLQLESDILAELNLHPSGILSYEEHIPWPDGRVLIEEFGFSDPVVKSYYCQLYLRKRLNEIHGLLYNPTLDHIDEEGNPLPDIEHGLFNMVWVPELYRFHWQEAPARDILSARIRAKWWGAQVITYRPLIRKVLAYSYERKNTQNSGQESPAISHDTIDNARKGIHALIESTRAFHNLEDKRFVITNVFGTAHAQWGNLLVLAAVFKDPILSQFVAEDTLLELFRRTIEFMQVVAQPTSSLMVDMRILEGLEKQILRREFGVGANSSFSSGASVPPQTPASGTTTNNTSMLAPSTPGPGVVLHPAPMQL